LKVSTQRFVFRANFKKLEGCIRKLEMMKRCGIVVLNCRWGGAGFVQGLILTSDITFREDCELFQYMCCFLATYYLLLFFQNNEKSS